MWSCCGVPQGHKDLTRPELPHPIVQGPPSPLCWHRQLLQQQHPDSTTAEGSSDGHQVQPGVNLGWVHSDLSQVSKVQQTCSTVQVRLGSGAAHSSGGGGWSGHSQTFGGWRTFSFTSPVDSHPEFWCKYTRTGECKSFPEILRFGRVYLQLSSSVSLDKLSVYWY